MLTKRQFSDNRSTMRTPLENSIASPESIHPIQTASGRRRNSLMKSSVLMTLKWLSRVSMNLSRS